MANRCKFQMADPLNPNPMGSMGRGAEEPTVEEIMSESTDDRVSTAMRELAQKAAGLGGRADRWAVSTGDGSDQVVPAHAAKIAQQRKQQGGQCCPDEQCQPNKQAVFRVKQQNPEEDSDDDDFDDDDLLNDPELDRLRFERIQQMKEASEKKHELLGKGHGQFREIVQDEFLKEVCGSEFVLCHFYHKDFERCKVMDKHLQALAVRHIECKFLKIDAEKTPFFVDKLQIRVLPTVVCFKDGIAYEQRQVGFEGLTEGLAQGKEDEWKTTDLAKKLSEIGVIEYTPPPTDEELEKYGMKGKKTIWGGVVCKEDDYDDDDDDLNTATGY